MSSTREAPSLRSKSSANFETSSLKKKASGYFESPSLKKKISSHFSRRGSPSINRDDIHVLRTSPNNTLGWKPDGDDDKSPVSSPSTTKQHQSSSTAATRPDHETDATELTPCSSPSSPSFAGPLTRIEWNNPIHQEDEGPAWLSSPRISTDTPLGPFSAVSNTENSPNSSNPAFRPVSVIPEDEEHCSNTTENEVSVTRGPYISNPAAPKAPFSLVYETEEPFVKDSTKPLRLSKKDEPGATNGNLSSTPPDEYYPSVAPLSTPSRKLAFKNQTVLQTDDMLAPGGPKSSETSRKPPSSQLVFDRNCSVSNLPNQLDHDDAISVSSSCYSKTHGCHRHQRERALQHLADLPHESSPDLLAEPQSYQSSQVVTHRGPRRYRPKIVIPNNPYYNYAEAATRTSGPKAQMSMPAMKIPDGSDREANQHQSGSIISHRPWDFSTSEAAKAMSPSTTTHTWPSATVANSSGLYPTSTLSTSQISPFSPSSWYGDPPPLPPRPSGLQEHFEEHKPGSERDRTEPPKSPAKRVKKFFGRALHRMGEKFTKLAGKLNKNDDDGRPPPWVEDMLEHHSYDTTGRREYARCGNSYPLAVIDRNESGFFERYGRPMRDHAEQQRFEQMLSENHNEQKIPRTLEHSDARLTNK